MKFYNALVKKAGEHKGGRVGVVYIGKPSVLYFGNVVNARSHLLVQESSHVNFSAAQHHQNLPWLSVLANAFEARGPRLLIDSSFLLLSDLSVAVLAQFAHLSGFNNRLEANLALLLMVCGKLIFNNLIKRFRNQLWLSDEALSSLVDLLDQVLVLFLLDERSRVLWGLRMWLFLRLNLIIIEFCYPVDLIMRAAQTTFLRNILNIRLFVTNLQRVCFSLGVYVYRWDLGLGAAFSLIFLMFWK